MAREMAEKTFTYILRRPLLISQNNTLDNLNAGEAATLASGLQVLKDDALELFVLAQVFEAVALDAVLGCEIFEGFLDGENDGDGLGFVLCGMNTDVAHDGGGAVDGLELGFYTLVSWIGRWGD